MRRVLAKSRRYTDDPPREVVSLLLPLPLQPPSSGTGTRNSPCCRSGLRTRQMIESIVDNHLSQREPSLNFDKSLYRAKLSPISSSGSRTNFLLMVPSRTNASMASKSSFQSSMSCWASVADIVGCRGVNRAAKSA